MNHNGIHLPNFKEEMTELYANRVVRYFGMSLVYVFIPVYLLSIGFSFFQVVLYLILKRIFIAATVPMAVYFDGRIGIKQTALLSAFAVSAFLIFLYSEFGVSTASLVVLGILEGVSMSLYWVPMNINFGLASKKGKSGEETATIVLLPRIAGIFTPIIGALIIGLFGFKSLLMTACLIIVGSTLPLFLSRERIILAKNPFNVMSVKARSMTGFFVLEGILSVSIIAWPLFVFLFSPSYEFVGFTASAQILAAVIATIIVGKYSDKLPKKKMFLIAGLFSAAVFIAAMAAESPTHVVIVSFLSGIAEVLVAIPVFAYVIEKTERREMTSVMAYREIVLSAAMVATLGILLVFSPIVAFEIVFFVSALSCVWLASCNPKA